MKPKYNILLDPNPPGGGGSPGSAAGTPDWKAALPEELRNNAVISTFKTPDDLVKSYISAQQLIGAKRIALPKPNATEQELNEFYQSIGRPEAIDKYSEGTVKPAEGLNIDKAGLAKAKETMFKLGLTDAQQKGLMDFYLSGLNENHSALTKETEQGRVNAENALRQEWGSKFDSNLSVVKNVIRHFGSDELAAELQTSLGNNVGLTKLLLKFGETLIEDKNVQKKFSIEVNTPAAARARIEELKSDVQFQKALNDRNDPGHNQAVELWSNVHRQLG